MKRIKILLFATFLSVLNMPTFAKELVVGVEKLNFYPHYSVGEDNQYTGFARAILDEFSKVSGHTLTYRMLPIPRLWDSFFRGEVDLKYPDNAYWNKGKKQSHTIYYTDPVVRYAEGVMVLPTNKGKGEAALKKLSLVRGFTPFGYTDQIKSGSIHAQESNNFEGAVKMAINSRSDGVYVNVAVAEHVLRGMGRPGGLVFDDGLPGAKDNFYLSSIKHQDVIDEFNKFLKNHQDKIQAIKTEFKIEAGLDG